MTKAIYKLVKKKFGTFGTPLKDVPFERMMHLRDVGEVPKKDQLIHLPVLTLLL